MNRSTCFGHYYAHHQELATVQMVSAYGSSPWLWQVAGLVHGCRFLERPVRGMVLLSSWYLGTFSTRRGRDRNRNQYPDELGHNSTKRLCFEPFNYVTKSVEDVFVAHWSIKLSLDSNGRRSHSRSVLLIYVTCFITIRFVGLLLLIFECNYTLVRNVVYKQADLDIILDTLRVN